MDNNGLPDPSPDVVRAYLAQGEVIDCLISHALAHVLKVHPILANDHQLATWVAIMCLEKASWKLMFITRFAPTVPFN